jgi:ParB/RepB/Spo0J family partition protein
VAAKQAAEGRRLNAFAVDPNELVIIGFDTDDGPEHPLWDKRCKLPPDENLARRMIRDGFRGAIEVRKNGKKLEVVFGRRRVKSCRLAREIAKKEGTEAPDCVVRVVRGDDHELFGTRVSENTLRKDLAIIEKAEELKRYMALGRTEEEAAEIFDMTKAGVKNLLRLFDLDTSVRKSIESGDISFSAGAELADLPRDEQKEQLGKLLDDAKKGIKPTARAAKRGKAQKARKAGDDGAAVPPPKRLVQAVLKLNKKLPEKEQLPDDFVRGIYWMLGELGSDRIKGLRDLEKTYEDGRASNKKD